VEDEQKERTGGRRIVDAHRREIVRLVREFLAYADSKPQHLFAEGTRRFIEEVRPIVEQKDLLNKRSRK
jgi:hypothetical protein